MKHYSTGKYARSRNRMVAGVCAMIARDTGIDVGLVRIITVVATVLTSGAVAVAYLAAWAVLPMEGEKTTVLDDLIGKTKSKVADYQHSHDRQGWSPSDATPGPAPRPPSTPTSPTAPPASDDPQPPPAKEPGAKTSRTGASGSGSSTAKPNASKPAGSKPTGSKPSANKPKTPRTTASGDSKPAAADAGEAFDPYDES